VDDWCNACDAAADDDDGSLALAALTWQTRCYDLMPNSCTVIVFDLQLPVLSLCVCVCVCVCVYLCVSVGTNMSNKPNSSLLLTGKVQLSIASVRAFVSTLSFDNLYSLAAGSNN